MIWLARWGRSRATCLFAYLFLTGFGDAFAVTLYAINGSNAHLIAFSSDTPSTLSTDVALSGVTGYTLKAVSFRPSTGELYGFAIPQLFGAARLVKIDVTTGGATTVGDGPTVSDSASTQYGMAFDPVTDQIRIVSGSSNFRINPGTGTLIADDGALAYAASDPRTGQPVLTGKLAYTNAFSGPVTEATAHVVETGSSGFGAIDVVATLGSPSGTPISATSGTLFSVADLSWHSTSNQGGFVVEPRSRTGYAVFRQSGVSSLYSVNLSTGAAQLLGPVGTGSNSILGLALAPVAAVHPCLDPDGDGKVQPLTDGLLLLRAMLGLTGAAVTDGALPTPAPPRASWSAIRTHMNSNCYTNFAP